MFKGLNEGGMPIAFREAQPPERHGGPERGPAVEAKFKGETFTIKFSQRSRPAERAGGAKLRKENSWAKDFESQPSEKLTFSIAGNVYGAEKVWQGTQAKLESLGRDCEMLARCLSAPSWGHGHQTGGRRIRPLNEGIS